MVGWIVILEAVTILKKGFNDPPSIHYSKLSFSGIATGIGLPNTVCDLFQNVEVT